MSLDFNEQVEFGILPRKQHSLAYELARIAVQRPTLHSADNALEFDSEARIGQLDRGESGPFAEGGGRCIVQRLQPRLFEIADGRSGVGTIVVEHAEAQRLDNEERDEQPLDDPRDRFICRLLPAGHAIRVEQGFQFGKLAAHGKQHPVDITAFDAQAVEDVRLARLREFHPGLGKRMAGILHFGMEAHAFEAGVEEAQRMALVQPARTAQPVKTPVRLLHQRGTARPGRREHFGNGLVDAVVKRDVARVGDGDEPVQRVFCRLELL